MNQTMVEHRVLEILVAIVILSHLKTNEADEVSA